MSTAPTTPAPPSAPESSAQAPASTPATGKAQCGVCAVNDAKYKCPRCSARTCSLACVKQHKAAENCDGQRSKTHFVSMEQYDENTLYSDYTFLEDVARTADVSARARVKDPVIHKVAGPRAARAGKLTPKQRYLVTQAGKRGVRLRFLPRGMSRASANQSYYDAKQDKLFWTIEFVFVDLPAENSDTTSSESLTVTLPRVHATATLASAMAPLFDPASPQSLKDPHTHARLKAWYGDSATHMYLKRPFPHANARNVPAVVALATDQLLMDAIQSQVLVEFPTVWVTREPIQPEVAYVVPPAGSEPAPKEGAEEGEVDDEEEDGEIAEVDMEDPVPAGLPDDEGEDAVGENEEAGLLPSVPSLAAFVQSLAPDQLDKLESALLTDMGGATSG
ncbi:Box C/D snoRNA protein 1 [Allomyces arbusculus]|nr:Box C/D snoRNA protein 1 [Allomyces arbusculus]